MVLLTFTCASFLFQYYLFRSNYFFFFGFAFGSLYLARYFCSYSLRSFFMSRFGFGFSGLYKLELAAFFFGFAFCCLLYLARYSFSYSFRFARYSLCLVIACFRKFNLPRSSDFRLDDFFGFAFGALYRMRYFFSYDFRSACNSFRFLSICSRRFNRPKSNHDQVFY